jgi:hypothetical protein
MNYKILVDEKRIESVARAYQKGIASLNALGFRELGVELPVSSILSLPSLPLRLLLGEQVGLNAGFRLSIFTPLLTDQEGSCLGQISACNTEFITCFTDQSLLISNTSTGLACQNDDGNIEIHYDGSSKTATFHAHRLRIEQRQNLGKTAKTPHDFDEFVHAKTLIAEFRDWHGSATKTSGEVV